MDEKRAGKYVTLGRLATFKRQGDLHWVVRDELEGIIGDVLDGSFEEATEAEIMGITAPHTKGE